MTIHADFAQWIAVVRYDVVSAGARPDQPEDPGGLGAPQGEAAPLGRGTLQPSAHIVGLPSAFLTIAPRRPLWGSHRFVLRSTLPLGSDREIVHPEVAPLGWGAVDAYLGVVNATGHPLPAEDATGLKPITYATRFGDREFTRDAGIPTSAFHVEEKQWVLCVKLPRTGTEPPGSRDDAAHVSQADVALTVLPDRSIVGRALYEVLPDSGRFLTVELPPGSKILWAAVEPDPVLPLRSGPGAWSIVLDAGRQDCICLVWKTPPAGAGAGAGAAATTQGMKPDLLDARIAPRRCRAVPDPGHRVDATRSGDRGDSDRPRAGHHGPGSARGSGPNGWASRSGRRWRSWTGARAAITSVSSLS